VYAESHRRVYKDGQLADKSDKSFEYHKSMEFSGPEELMPSNDRAVVPRDFFGKGDNW
jgi:hypothetical protein